MSRRDVLVWNFRSTCADQDRANCNDGRRALTARGCGRTMPVQRWSGREARALRVALRLSVRAFAAHLGIAARTVSKWEAGGEAVQPRPDTQAMLDTALIRADGAAQQRFEMLCRSGPAAVAPLRRQQWEYESWVDDLDRASLR